MAGGSACFVEKCQADHLLSSRGTVVESEAQRLRCASNPNASRRQSDSRTVSASIDSARSRTRQSPPVAMHRGAVPRRSFARRRFSDVVRPAFRFIASDQRQWPQKTQNDLNNSVGDTGEEFLCPRKSSHPGYLGPAILSRRLFAFTTALVGLDCEHLAHSSATSSSKIRSTCARSRRPDHGFRMFKRFVDAARRLRPFPPTALCTRRERRPTVAPLFRRLLA